MSFKNIKHLRSLLRSPDTMGRIYWLGKSGYSFGSKRKAIEKDNHDAKNRHCQHRGPGRPLLVGPGEDGLRARPVESAVVSGIRSQNPTRPSHEGPRKGSAGPVQGTQGPSRTDEVRENRQQQQHGCSGGRSG